MNKRQWLVSLLGFLALAALFLKLPEVPHFSGCQGCFPKDPYLPLIGAGYFSILIAIALLFPSFPSRNIAKSGLTWSILLAGALTYVNLPTWCGICLFAHGCHIMMWTIWTLSSSPSPSAGLSMTEKACILFFGPLAIVALFSTLNLTFMAYGLKINQPPAMASLKVGDLAPTFTVESSTGHFISTENNLTSGLVINFVSPDCSYCKQQLPLVNEMAAEKLCDSYQFVHISTSLPPELTAQSTAVQWVEDKQGALRGLFKVNGYPTLFVISNDRKIVQIIPGASEQLKAELLAILTK